MTIAVTTPTGHVGSRAVQLLVQAGVRPRLLVRDPDRLDAAVRDRSDVWTGDLADADFLCDATAGVDTLLWVVPEPFTATDPVGDMARMGAHAAGAVRVNGIERVVMVSSIGAELRDGAGLIDGLGRNELQIDASGADVTLLRCGYFFTNLLGGLEELKSGRLTTTMTPDVAMPWVDPRDVGEIAAARLLDHRWTGRTVQGVFGPANLTWAEVAVIVGTAISQEITLKVVSDDDLRDSLSATGMPEAAVEGVVRMTAGLRDGFTPEQRRDYLSTTPTTLAAWAYATLRPLLRT
jgi:uncharacterized protein YbjT (DUF2867 family)